MKTNTTRFLKWKRNFLKASDLVLGLNAYLARHYGGQITKTRNVVGNIVKGRYADEYAIAVIIGAGRKDGRQAVAYQLYLMEQEENNNIIKGGVVIYVTSHVSEWKPNECIAIEPTGKHNGKPFTLTNKYYEDWNGATSAKRKFALFFTKGAMNQIDS